MWQNGVCIYLMKTTVDSISSRTRNILIKSYIDDLLSKFLYLIPLAFSEYIKVILAVARPYGMGISR